MRYVSLDVETTGLDPKVNQIIEIGAIIDDSDPSSVLRKTPIKNLPRFHAYVVHDRYVWDEVALKLNWKLMETILFGKDNVPRYKETELLEALLPWLGDTFFAGKNFGGFDRLFLQSIGVKTHHRALDPTTFFFDKVKDSKPPSLYECAKRLGVEGYTEHRALDDAELVILCLRHGWKHNAPLG